jgi:hypothetical protein
MKRRPCPYCGNAPVLYERDIFPRYMEKCDSDGKDCLKMCVRSNSIHEAGYKWDRKVKKIRLKINKKKLKIKSYRERREWRKKW